MSEEKEKFTEIESEVLVEKVRELELTKQKAESSDAQNLERDNTAVILNEKRELSEPLSDDEAKQQMSSRSRRNFLIGGATALAGIFGWRFAAR
jgi:hypothetical protein